MINAIPHIIDIIQRTRARLLSLWESTTKPSRNLVCALRANANANKPEIEYQVLNKIFKQNLRTYRVERIE